MRWVRTKEQAAYMRELQRKNAIAAESNPAEQWAHGYLKKARLGLWRRQHLWGVRIFDFWHHKKGVAVEIDGNTHDAGYDLERDRFAFLRSGIIVLRVPNFDEGVMTDAISHLRNIGLWKARRKAMGGNAKRRLLAASAGYVAHAQWTPGVDTPRSEKLTHGARLLELTDEFGGKFFAGKTRAGVMLKMVQSRAVPLPGATNPVWNVLVSRKQWCALRREIEKLGRT